MDIRKRAFNSMKEMSALALLNLVYKFNNIKKDELIDSVVEKLYPKIHEIEKNKIKNLIKGTYLPKIKMEISEDDLQNISEEFETKIQDYLIHILDKENLLDKLKKQEETRKRWANTKLAKKEEINYLEIIAQLRKLADTLEEDYKARLNQNNRFER